MFMHLVCLLVTLSIIFGLVYAKPLLQNRSSWIRTPIDYPFSLYNRLFSQPRLELDLDFLDNDPPSDMVQERSMIGEGYEHSDLWERPEIIKDRSERRIPEMERFLENTNGRKENEGHKETAVGMAQPVEAQGNISINVKENPTKEHLLQTFQSTYAPTNKFNSNHIYMILQESLKQNMAESKSMPETGGKSTSKENGTTSYTNGESASKVNNITQRVWNEKSSNDSMQ